MCTRLELLFLSWRDRRMSLGFTTGIIEQLSNHSPVCAWNVGDLWRAVWPRNMRVSMPVWPDTGSALQNTGAKDQKGQMEPLAVPVEIWDTVGFCHCVAPVFFGKEWRFRTGIL